MSIDEMSKTVKSPPLPTDRAAIIAALKGLAETLGRRPTRGAFLRSTGLSVHAIRKAFGAYWKLLQACGYETHGWSRLVSDEALLKGLRDAIEAADGIVRPETHRKHSRNHPRTVAKRWGGWDRALAALRDWLEVNEPGFAYLPALRQHCSGIPDVVARQPAPRYGELLRFRALDHQPLNENGVIFLFGLVADELGFVIETVQTKFPDAIGRRRVDDGWRHVRIEFEHRSRNFRDHGHDPGGCDLIVCWDHDWQECPVEVLELRREIATLPNSLPTLLRRTVPEIRVKKGI